MATDQQQRLSRAFRDVCLTLIALFRVYGVGPELDTALCLALRDVFERHLDPDRSDRWTLYRSALCDLVDELNKKAGLRPASQSDPHLKTCTPRNTGASTGPAET